MRSMLQNVRCTMWLAISILGNLSVAILRFIQVLQSSARTWQLLRHLPGHSSGNATSVLEVVKVRPKPPSEMLDEYLIMSTRVPGNIQFPVRRDTAMEQQVQRVKQHVRQSIPQVGVSQQGPLRSLIEVVQEAPTLLEMLPPVALKNLSATCRSLRTSFRNQVKVISLQDVEDAAKLCCTTWPQLLLVACICFDDDSMVQYQLQHLLSPQWECMMHMSILTVHRSLKAATLGVVLVRPHQKHHKPLIDLPSKHCAALSDFADKHRQNAFTLHLGGPLVGCRAVQALAHGSWPRVSYFQVVKSPQLGVKSMSHLADLCSPTTMVFQDCFLDASMMLRLAAGWRRLQQVRLPNNQLDAKAVCAMTHAKLSFLHCLDLSHNPLGTVGVQHLVSWSLPSLGWLHLKHVRIDAAACFYLARGQWPALRGLDLDENNISTAGVAYVVQGRWRHLQTLTLSAQGLDEEACLLLGIESSTAVAQLRQVNANIRSCHTYSPLSNGSRLPQLERCVIQLT